MNIDGSTKVLCIIGDPIEHSLSPAIQNAAFKELGLDMVYVPFRVAEDRLEEAVNSIRALNMAGMNVTIPHKEKVMMYLDRVDELARFIGAVNTIVNRDGELTGYNTDADGYLESLAVEAGFDPKGKNVIIVGAGGAGRAILCAFLAAEVNSVVIANRTYDRAKKLADEFRIKNESIEAVDFDGIYPYIKTADLIVNTTSLGMMDKGSLDLPLGLLPKGSVVSDIVYRPLKTEFLKKAVAIGLKTHGGLGMLVYQGAIGFELWTGKKAPVEAMKKAALEALKEK